MSTLAYLPQQVLRHAANHTARLSLPSSNAQLQSSSAVLQTTHELLASCPTSLYLIYTQPNAHASDLRDPQTGKCLAPSLCAHLPSAPQIKTSFGVAEVIGAEISAADLQAYIETACAAQAGRESPSIAVTQLDALPPSSHRLGAGTGTGAGETRAVAMRTADWQLGQALNVTAESRGADYTVIYFASPHEPPRNYESEFVESPMEPMELRRRSDVMVERAAGEKTNSTQPLFVKYQFFTPGTYSKRFFLVLLGSSFSYLKKVGLEILSDC